MRWLGWLVVLTAILLGVALFALTDAKPKLTRSAQVSMADLERGKAIVGSLGLRRMREGEVRQLALTESDLDKGVNYLAHHLAGGSASAQIVKSKLQLRLQVRASFPVPLPGGNRRYVNLELVLASGDTILQPVQLHLGKLDLPAGFSGKLVRWGLARSAYGNELAAARGLLDSAQLSGQNLVLRFTWRNAVMQKMLAGGAAQGVDEATLKVYRDRLGAQRSGDFAILLGEAFALAQARSKSGDPVAENRAALTVLAERALGSRLLSKQGMARIDRRTSIKLAGRNDFAQHFALSAFLAATGGENLSNLAGLYKELNDAQAGSGFSFNDLAADLAGSHLGEVSTGSRAAALQMQKKLANVRDAGTFFPKVRDLPEFISQAEFQRRFGGVGQPDYQRMMQRIEKRIAELAIYRD